MRLALGTAQFGSSYGIANRTGQVPRPAARAMLRAAAQRGIDTLDTTTNYAKSEAVLGETGTGDFKVVTKLPGLPDGCEDVNRWVSDEVAGSLGRLRIDRLEGLLLHRPADLLGPSGSSLFRALVELKDAGQVGKIGASVYSPSELDALAGFRLDLIQAPLNLIDRRILASGWLRRLHTEGVEVHARSAFLQGLLLMPRDAIPAKFERWSGIWDNWHHWLGGHDVSAVRACIAFPLSFPEVHRVVVGADSVFQLEEIASASMRPPAPALPDLACVEELLVRPDLWSRL